MKIIFQFNSIPAEMFVFIFRHLKPELLMQFPASNDKYMLIFI